MPAATSKTELLKVTEKEWGKLWALVETVPDRLRVVPDDEETSSAKDVLAHRAHWIGLFFQWVEEGERTGTAAMPDHGVKWNQLKPYNAALRKRYADRSWPCVCETLEAAHARLVTFLKEADEARLYGTAMPGGTGWTMGRYAEAAGPSHYRSAAKYIRSRLRAAG